MLRFFDYRYPAEVLQILNGDRLWVAVDLGFGLRHRVKVTLSGVCCIRTKDKTPTDKATLRAAKRRLQELIPEGSCVLLQSIHLRKSDSCVGEVWPAAHWTHGGETPSVNETLISERLAIPFREKEKEDGDGSD